MSPSTQTPINEDEQEQESQVRDESSPVIARLRRAGSTWGLEQPAPDPEAPSPVLQRLIDFRRSNMGPTGEDTSHLNAAPDFTAGHLTTSGGIGNHRGTGEAAFDRGISQQIKGAIAETTRVFGHMIDEEAIVEWGEEGIMNALAQAAANPAEINDIDEIETFSDLGTWALELAGSQLPNLAYMGASYTVGGRLVKGGAWALGKMGFDKMAKAAVGKAAAASIVSGAVGTSVLTSGEVAKELREAGYDTPDALEVFGPGVAMGALEFASAGTIYARTFGKLVSPGTAHAFTDQMLRSSGLTAKQVLRAVGREGIKSSIQEGITETLQEGIVYSSVPGRAQKLLDNIAKKFTDPTYEFMDDPENAEIIHRLKNSAAAGAGMGLMFGGAGSTMTSSSTIHKLLDRRSVDEEEAKDALKEIDTRFDTDTQTDSKGNIAPTLFDFSGIRQSVEQTVGEVTKAFTDAQNLINNKARAAKEVAPNAFRAAESARQTAAGKLETALAGLNVAESIDGAKSAVMRNLARVQERIAELPTQNIIDSLPDIQKMQRAAAERIAELKALQKEAIKKGDLESLRGTLKESLTYLNEAVTLAEQAPNSVSPKQLKAMQSIVESLLKHSGRVQKMNLKTAKESLANALETLDKYGDLLSTEFRERVAKRSALSGQGALDFDADADYFPESTSSQAASVAAVRDPNNEKSAALISRRLGRDPDIVGGLVRIDAPQAGGVIVTTQENADAVRQALAENKVGEALGYFESREKQDQDPSTAKLATDVTYNGEVIESIAEDAHKTGAVLQGRERRGLVAEAKEISESLMQRLNKFRNSLSTDIENSQGVAASIYQNLREAYEVNKEVGRIPDSTLLYGDFTVGDLRESRPDADGIIHDIIFDETMRQLLADISDGTTPDIFFDTLFEGEPAEQRYWLSGNYRLVPYGNVFNENGQEVVPEKVRGSFDRKVNSAEVAQRRLDAFLNKREKRGLKSVGQWSVAYDDTVGMWYVAQHVPENFNDLVIRERIRQMKFKGNQMKKTRPELVVGVPFINDHGKLETGWLFMPDVARLGKLDRSLSYNGRESAIDVKGNFVKGVDILMEHGFQIDEKFFKPDLIVSGALTWGQLTGPLQRNLQRNEAVLRDPNSTVEQRKNARSSLYAIGVDSSLFWSEATQKGFESAAEIIRWSFVQRPTLKRMQWADKNLTALNEKIAKLEDEAEFKKSIPEGTLPLAYKQAWAQRRVTLESYARQKQFYEAVMAAEPYDQTRSIMGITEFTKQEVEDAAALLKGMGVSPREAAMMDEIGVWIELDPDLREAQMEAAGMKVDSDGDVSDNIDHTYSPSGAEQMLAHFEASNYERQQTGGGVNRQIHVETHMDGTQTVQYVDPSVVTDPQQIQIATFGWTKPVVAKMQKVLRGLGITDSLVVYDEDSQADIVFALRQASYGMGQTQAFEALAMADAIRLGKPGGAIFTSPTQLPGMPRSFIFVSKHASNRNFMLTHELGHFVQERILDNAPAWIRDPVRAVGSNANEVFADIVASRLQKEFGWDVEPRPDTLYKEQGENEAFTALNKLATQVADGIAAVIRFAQATFGLTDHINDLITATQSYNKYEGAMPNTPHGQQMLRDMQVAGWNTGQVQDSIGPVGAGVLGFEVPSAKTVDEVASSELAKGLAWGSKMMQMWRDNPAGSARALLYTAGAEMRSFGPMMAKLAAEFDPLPGETNKGDGETVHQQIERQAGAFHAALYSIIQDEAAAGKADNARPLNGEAIRAIFEPDYLIKDPAVAKRKREIEQELLLERPSKDPTVRRVRLLMNEMHQFYTADPSKVDYVKVTVGDKQIHLVPLGLDLKYRGNYFPGIANRENIATKRQVYIDILVNKQGMNRHEAEGVIDRYGQDGQEGFLADIDVEIEDDIYGPSFFGAKSRTFSPETRRALAREDFYVSDIPTVIGAYTSAMIRRGVWESRYRETRATLTEEQRVEFAKQVEAEKELLENLTEDFDLAGLSPEEREATIRAIIKRDTGKYKVKSRARTKAYKTLREYTARQKVLAEHRKIERAYAKHDVNINDPIATIKLQMAQAKANGELTEWQEDRMINNILPAMLGRQSLDMGPMKRKTISSLVVLANVRLLAYSVFSSFVDFGTLLNRAGAASFSEKGLHKLIKEASSEDARVMARMLGILRGGITSHVLNDQIINSHMTSGAQKMNNAFFKWNGMEAWTNQMRTLAMLTGREFLKRHARLAQEGNPLSQQWLKDLSVTAEDIDAWDGSDLKNASIAKALNRFVDESMIRPTPGQRPAWGSDPMYALFFHLKGFMYGFYTTFTRRAFYESKLYGKEYGVPGAAMPFMLIGALMMPLAAAGWEMKKKINGSTYGNSMSGLEYMAELAERTGAYGPYQMLLDMESSAEFGKPRVFGVTGPTLEFAYDAVTKPVESFLPRAVPVVAVTPRLR